MKNKVINKIRERRDYREFNRALDTASPRMRSELIAMAQQQSGGRHNAS